MAYPSYYHISQNKKSPSKEAWGMSLFGMLIQDGKEEELSAGIKRNVVNRDFGLSRRSALRAGIPPALSSYWINSWSNPLSFTGPINLGGSSPNSLTEYFEETRQGTGRKGRLRRKHRRDTRFPYSPLVFHNAQRGPEKKASEG